MNWKATWSKGVKLAVPAPGKRILKFVFPQGDGIHMLTHPVTHLDLQQNVSATFEITGDHPVFWSAGGGTPQVHLFFETGDLGARYWSSYADRIDLKLGIFALTVPLKPARWTDVNGVWAAANPVAFRKALKSADNAGFSFGDEKGAYAHGAGLKSGSAKFWLKSFLP